MESSSGYARVTSLNMLVVSVVLCKCFLKDGSPERAIITDMGEDGFVSSVPHFLKREPVIDDDGVGNTESEQVDTVDTGSVQFIVIVEEGVLEAAWHISHSGSCGKEPAVSEPSLINIIGRHNAISAEEGVLTLDLSSSLPSD